VTVAAGPVIAVSPPHVHTCDADPRHARPRIRVHSGKRFTLSTTDLSYTAGSPAEKHEVPPPVTFPDAPSLGEFIASHQSELRAAMASALRGRADVDDALQQAYLRLINEYDRWPAEQTPQERLAFAYRTIQLAAKDALRQAFGRSDRAPRPREIAVDFSSDGRDDNDAAGGATAQLLAQDALREVAGRYPGDDEHLDNALKVAALAALDPVAHQIVTASQLGLNHKQVAKELGLTHQTVRAKDSEARALLLSLLACARGRDVREASDINLFGYLEGQKLGRAERRLVQGHLRHCLDCQEIAALAGEVDSLAKRLVLPIPLLLATRGAIGHVLGVKGSMLSSGAGGTSTSGFTAAGTGAGGWGSLAAGKLAAGIAAIALIGGAGSALVVAHGATGHTEARVDGRATLRTWAAFPQRKVLPAPHPATSRSKAGVRRHRQRDAGSTHAHKARSSLRPAVPPPAPAVSTAPTTVTTRSSPSLSPPPPSRGGGEFVLGG
jgi:RNA polymerase sigma factor (sigma-70 family)